MEAARMTAAMMVPLSGRVVRGESKTAQRMGVAMDGMMVNIREEGWKELKVGCVFKVELQQEGQGKTGEPEEHVRAVNNSYTAVLGGPKRFGQAV